MVYQFTIKISKRDSLLFTVNASEEGITQIDFRFAPCTFAPQKSFPFGMPSYLSRLKKILKLYFKGHRVSFASIPLDKGQAPDFYRKIWLQTRKIPLGRVITYERLAELSGCKRASRAVGNAMKKNPFPILIPCHRVVRKNGSLGGYSKGLKIKRMLLTLEKSLVDKIA